MCTVKVLAGCHHSPGSSTNSHRNARLELCFYGRDPQAHIKPIAHDRDQGAKSTLRTSSVSPLEFWRQNLVETRATHDFYLGNAGLGPKPHRKGNASLFCVHVFHTHQDFKSHDPNVSSFSVHFFLKQQKLHQIRQKYFEPTFKKVKVTQLFLLYKAKEEKVLTQILWL